jgi:hypothetical protein
LVLCAVCTAQAPPQKPPVPPSGKPAVKPAQESAAKGPRQVKLVIGNLVAADKAIPSIQGFGPALIRTELTRNVGRNQGVKLYTLLERDQNFQMDVKISDDEHQGAYLNPINAKKAFSNQINYFIFLTYASVDGQHIRLVGQLAKVKPGETGVVIAEKAVINSQDPDLTTFGQNLYLDILREEGVDLGPQNFSLVFCAGDARDDPALAYVRNSVKQNFTLERPRVVDAIQGKTCSDAGSSSENEILVHCKLVPMGIEVEIVNGNTVVAYGYILVVSLELFMKEDPAKKVEPLIQQIRQTWHPPS